MTNKEIGDQLWQLYDILHGCPFCKNLDGLSAASSRCLNNLKEDFWHFEIPNLLFSIDKKVDKLQVAPNHIDDIELEFYIKAKGKIGSFEVDEYDFNLVITGWFINNESSAIEKAICCWHLDWHPHLGNSILDDVLMHPKYHFQHGGKKIKGYESKLGNTFVMASPRIAYPPMDAILGIDFILTNFIHRDKITSVRADSRYRRLVQEAQKNYWKPYFDAISSSWHANQRGAENQFFPQLIC